MSFQVVAVITAKPGSEDAVRDAMKGLVAPTRAESGCLSYALSESSTAPGTFVTIEEWSEPSDLEAHLQTDHIKDALQVMGNELAEAPAIHSLTALDVS